jgi:hypothetical protein
MIFCKLTYAFFIAFSKLIFNLEVIGTPDLSAALVLHIRGLSSPTNPDLTAHFLS